MKVKVFATLRPLVGADALDLETGAGDKVSDALREIIQRWPQLKSELYDSNGELSNRIHIFLNGRDVRYLGGLDMEIPENADLRIFPPVGGGR
ncbi:MAG: MoaD/ThiS family protein [Chloroflexi bacterium]|nr:MoaD/ThiS family protein [Chloroflexota bacterium]